MIEIYKASAGSGKTFTLAREYIRMLLQDYAQRPNDMPHRHILAVTFTKKATAEMKERILGELYRLATDTEHSPYLNTFLADKSLGMDSQGLQQAAQVLIVGVLQDYSAFAVSTIDGFFQQVVRRFARELGLNAIYDLTLDSDEVVEMAIDSLMQRVRQTPKGQVSAWLTDFALKNMSDDRNWNPKKEIVAFSKQLMQEQLREQLPLVQRFFADKELLQAYRDRLQTICEQYEARYGVPNDYTRTKKKTTPELIEYLTAQHILDNLYPLGLLQDVAQEIEQTNRRLNRLPLAEINSLLTALIDEAETPFVYEKLGQWLHHFLIDEFQDTSTLQWRNFRPLISEAEAHESKNLIVGDVKQSIYRWRNSNWHLLEEVGRQFSKTTEPPMRHNFRSSPILVHANNDLFSLYRDYVADTLDKEHPDRALGQVVRTIYADDRLRQEPTQSFGGYVHYQFFEGTADEVTDKSLTSMLPVLESIRARGGRMGHVAVIVRKSKEAQQAAAFLTAHGYSVQSADGLLIDSDPSVRLLLALLERGLDRQQDSEGTLLHIRLEQLLPRPISKEDERQLAQAGAMSVYEQVQALIQLYALNERDTSAAYLTAFLDKIFAFTQTRSGDAELFLAYWERHRNRFSVPAAPSDDTLQIMTVHSSKGLEFDFVLLPFLSWEVGASRQENLIWCRPKQEPFSELPLVSVAAKKELMNTYFREDYEDELLDMYIDNLNLSYVAFTRAKHEMYAFGPAAKQKKDGTYSIRSLGNLLHSLLASRLDSELSLRIGEQKHYAAPKQAAADTMLNRYVYSPAFPRLQLRRHQSESTLMGSLMHDLMSRLTTWDDAEQALKDMVSEGVIRQEQVTDTRNRLNEFRSLCSDYTWFEHNERVLNEEDIITPTGGTFRPDRVVINGKQATVIDYKFGQEKHLATYQKQVQHYMTLFNQMGYQAKGYIVYAALKKIVPVQPQTSLEL